MNIQLLNWPVIIRIVVYGTLAILVGVKSVQAINGPRVGEKLHAIPLELTRQIITTAYT